MRSSKTGIPFKAVRIVILLAILLVVGLNAWLTKARITAWRHPLWVVIYPINGDKSKTSSLYIESFKKESFKTIEIFLEVEANRFGLNIETPITIKIAPEINGMPPKAPKKGNILKIIWWSLKIRYWAYVSDSFKGPAANIKMFVIYYDPATHKELEHSLVVEKSFIGVVRAFSSAKLEEKNNVVIAHELLHTLGATDKYNPITTQPVYPEGYADPNKKPLFPQVRAEIMGGRIPLSETRSKMPYSLAKVSIGEKSAAEINWRKD